MLVNAVHDIANGTASKENVMYLYGDDFAYSNAYACFDQLKKMVKLGNKLNKHNIEFKISTPSRYVDALLKENVTWPVKYDDGTTYYDSFKRGEEHRKFWSGYYTSRADFKKQIKWFKKNF